MKTLPYVSSEEEIRVGKKYYLGQLWDGMHGSLDEILESECVSPDEKNVVAFKIIEKDALDTLVMVTDIY